MSEYGIVPHLFRRQAADLALELIGTLEARGHRIRVPLSDATKTGLDRWAVPDAEFGAGLELAFSLGGDGTMLRTVDLVAPHGVPVLGVNAGHLGYLSAVQADELSTALEAVLRGDFGVETRMTLAIEVRPPDGPAATFLALNDAVFERTSSGHTVRLAVAFNEEHFVDYTADGLIIATPTGSTAYAFSARGPIVSPLMRAVVLVPVSPHMLFDRSLVLEPTEPIDVTILDGRPAALFVDGRECGVLTEGTRVRCLAGRHSARLVTLQKRHFHSILKGKFGLGEPH